MIRSPWAPIPPGTMSLPPPGAAVSSSPAPKGRAWVCSYLRLRTLFRAPRLPVPASNSWPPASLSSRAVPTMMSLPGTKPLIPGAVPVWEAWALETLRILVMSLPGMPSLPRVRRAPPCISTMPMDEDSSPSPTSQLPEHIPSRMPRVRSSPPAT